MNVLSQHPYLFGCGAVLVVLGILLWRWASRHDLKGLAVDAAIQVAWNKGSLTSAADTEIARRLKDIHADQSNVGRAKKVAGHAARHVVAQIANIAGLAAFGLGVVLIGLALYLS